MPNLTAIARIRLPAAPVDLSDLLDTRDYSFVITPDDLRDTPLFWPQTFPSMFQPSRAHAVEVEELQKLFLNFLLGTEQLADDPYTLVAKSDQFEYENVIRPVTQTLRARVNFQGRAQPLPIVDD